MAHSILKHTNAFFKWTSVILAILAITACSLIDSAEVDGNHDFDVLAKYPIRHISEPSGIVWHPLRNSLYIVDDEGTLGEVSLEGEVLQTIDYSGRDFEGITVHPLTGDLYLAIEGEEKIWEINSVNLELKRKFKLPREYQGETVMQEGDNGIEGITFVLDSNHSEGGYFLIAHQAKSKTIQNEVSGILQVDVGLLTNSAVQITQIFKIKYPDLSGIHFDSNSKKVYVIADDKNQLLKYNLNFDLLQEYRLPGIEQEGITIDHQGNIYLADDTGGFMTLKIPTP